MLKRRPVCDLQGETLYPRRGTRIHWVLAIVLLSVMAGDTFAQERRIEVGDRIQIMVIGNEELSRFVAVRPDGTVSYPFLDEERITGYSLFELRLLVRTTLSQFLDAEIQAVDVLWVEEGGIAEEITVAVLGQVMNPGEYIVPRTAGLQAALTAAGGTLTGALERSIKIHRNNPDGLAVLMVDLERFYATGDVRYVPDIQSGDVIVVPGGTAATAIRVVGAVENPGNYQAPPGAKVFDLIIQAGGFTTDARTDKVRLVKPSTGVSEEYALDVNAFFESGVQPDTPPVEPGDIIIVPERLVSWRRVFGGLRDIASVTTIVTLFILIFR